MNDLEMYREQLALCDDKIIDALMERNAIIEKIMAYKEEYGMPILQPQQERKQKVRLEQKLEHNKYQDEIYDVFQRILKNSKRIQARKLFDYNIVLIGFMGAGKTTVSDYLSTMFDMDIIEMDQEITDREEMSIPDIFAAEGEEGFRAKEAAQIARFGKEKGLVLSCGGGAVKRAENVRALRQNGVVLFIDRPVEALAVGGNRPLSSSAEALRTMEAQRRPLYLAAADAVISNTGTLAEALAAAQEALDEIFDS